MIFLYFLIKNTNFFTKLILTIKKIKKQGFKIFFMEVNDEITKMLKM